MRLSSSKGKFDPIWPFGLQPISALGQVYQSCVRPQIIISCQSWVYRSGVLLNGDLRTPTKTLDGLPNGPRIPSYKFHIHFADISQILFGSIQPWSPNEPNLLDWSWDNLDKWL